MNFRLILILSLGLLIFISMILFTLISYKNYGETTKKSSEFYKETSTLYYANFGTLICMLMVNGLLFLKR